MHSPLKNFLLDQFAGVPLDAENTKPLAWVKPAVLNGNCMWRGFPVHNLQQPYVPMEAGHVAATLLKFVAHIESGAPPKNDAAWLRYYFNLSNAEVFWLLLPEPVCQRTLGRAHRLVQFLRVWIWRMQAAGCTVEQSGLQVSARFGGQPWGFDGKNWVANGRFIGGYPTSSGNPFRWLSRAHVSESGSLVYAVLRRNLVWKNEACPEALLLLNMARFLLPRSFKIEQGYLLAAKGENHERTDSSIQR